MSAPPDDDRRAVPTSPISSPSNTHAPSPPSSSHLPSHVVLLLLAAAAPRSPHLVPGRPLSLPRPPARNDPSVNQASRVRAQRPLRRGPHRPARELRRRAPRGRGARRAVGRVGRQGWVCRGPSYVPALRSSLSSREGEASCAADKPTTNRPPVDEQPASGRATSCPSSAGASRVSPRADRRRRRPRSTGVIGCPFLVALGRSARC